MGGGGGGGGFTGILVNHGKSAPEYPVHVNHRGHFHHPYEFSLTLYGT